MLESNRFGFVKDESGKLYILIKTVQNPTRDVFEICAPMIGRSFDEDIQLIDIIQNAGTRIVSLTIPTREGRKICRICRREGNKTIWSDRQFDLQIAASIAPQPETGDDTPLYLMILLVSLVAVICIGVSQKKNKVK